MLTLPAILKGRVLYRKVLCTLPEKAYSPLIQLVGSVLADKDGVYIVAEGHPTVMLRREVNEADFRVRWNHAMHAPTRRLLMQALQIGKLDSCTVSDVLFNPATKRVVLDENIPNVLFIGMERKDA